ncbi:exodeoxyribonuclease VII large subunit [Quisquiliibacterium transsilvanicum]
MAAARMGPDSAPREGPGGDAVLSVSELNRAVASLLERSIPPLWVAGEISNFTRAASGHWYFTLKDSGAQVRAVMFRGRAQAVGFTPREGDRVEVRALAGLYQPRGDFQLGVELMRRAGAGDLYQRFLQLKEKLRAEGLLDDARKRALPPLPARVGVVTSLQAAALRDVLATLAARAPQVPVIVYPTPVQGAEAPAGIVAALRAAARRAECDVLLLVRGGGSIEDLWSFNDEAVARAVAASPIPVVCGVGHESDVTIADFVADLRAPTPTAAASLAVPDRRELLQRVARAAQQLSGTQQRLQALREQRVDIATRLLRSPSAYLEARGRHLDGLARRAAAAGAAALHRPAMRLARAWSLLRPPDTQAHGRALESLCARLARAQFQALQRRSERADALVHKLELVSPQAVLGRGYAIVRREAGEIVRSPAQVSPGERLDVLLAEGAIEVDVSGDASGSRP